MQQNQDTISITFDKSHIITIGEKLYSESIELIRELVNNAYDADASRVDIVIEPEKIIIRDNGMGMDLAGLRQYFNIGSPEKQINAVSPGYKRVRIGQFGIGKFASLSACDRFEVITQKGDFAARVIFDKETWEASPNDWQLPLHYLKSKPDSGNGTTVILHNVVREFNLDDVRAKISSGVPLKTPNFHVYLNGFLITPQSYSGHSISILEGTPFGAITGEIVILSSSAASTDNLGIECKVKGVTIKREFFGMESWGKEIARVRGEIYADFLPITSDRSGFITDSPEYQEFKQTMKRIMTDVRKQLGRLSDRKENRRASRALNDALDRIYAALLRNPDFSPFGPLPMPSDEDGIGGAGLKTKKPAEDRIEETPQEEALADIQSDTVDTDDTAAPETPIPQKLMKRPRTIKKLTPNAVVKKMRLGDYGVSCCLDHYGPEGPECFTEGTVIYINRDHPLYKREMKKAATFTMHIARLLTQEISLMKDIRSPRHAFDRQSKLLKDAFIDMV